MATVDTAPGSHATGMGGGGDGDDPTRRHRDDRPQGHRSDRSRNVLTPKKKEDVESLRKLVREYTLTCFYLRTTDFYP